MTTGTVIPIGSVAKQFTAAAILQLRDQGKLGLDDKASRYLDDTPDAWKAITVRQLLSHTSGLEEDPPGFEPFKLKPEGVAWMRRTFAAAFVGALWSVDDKLT